MAETLAGAYRKVGFLTLLSLGIFGVALVTHLASDALPPAYTWEKPFVTLKDICGLNWFPTIVFVAFLIGSWRRRGEWDIERLLEASGQQIDLEPFKPRLLRGGVGAVLLLVISAWLFPDHTVVDLMVLVVAGLWLGWQEPDRAKLAQFAGHVVVVVVAFSAVSYAFTVFKALLFVDAVPRDASIVAFEHALFGAHPHRVVAAWAADKPTLIEVCDWVYTKLFEHMAIVSVFLIGLRLARERTEYLSALAVCYLLGGPLYHLLPGVGPIYSEPTIFPYMAFTSILTEPLVSTDLQAWILSNTNQIRAGTSESLKTWEYIACMPSLHMAHEFVMLWYARHSRLGLAIAIVFTGVTSLAIVVLGWHYPVDAIGGLALAAVAIAVCRWQRDVLLPSALMTGADEALPPRRSVLKRLRKPRKAPDLPC